MIRFEITFEGSLVDTDDVPLTPGEVERVVDEVVAQFEILQAQDIDVSTNLESSELVVSITTEGTDLPEAQLIGNGIIRTAFHAAEVLTPGWSINWVKATTLPETDNHPEVQTALVSA